MNRVAIQKYTEPNPDFEDTIVTGSDPYTALDRFDRTVNLVCKRAGVRNLVDYTYTYDRVGNKLTQKVNGSPAPTNVDEFYGYDESNRVVTVTAPDPDNMAGGEAPLVTTYGYDIYSRLVSIENADGTITQRYNDAGELISITDELLNTTHFSYDLLGRLALETDATGATTSNFYNIHGRLVRQVDRNGQLVWHGQEGYTSSELWFDYGSATPPSIQVATITQGGGQVNEIQTVTVDDAENGTFRLAFGGETTFHLDYGASPGDVKSALEAMHAIDEVEVGISGNANDGYVYTITFKGNLSETDVDQLLVDVAAVNDGDVVRIIEYGFDAAGRLLSLADYDPGADLESDTDDTPLAANYTWSYDQLDRLIEQNETIVGLTPQIDLATIWDIVGRRTGMIATIDGNQDFANSYSYDYQNKPLWIYQQGQGTPDSDTNAVAYKRIEFRYNDIGQLTYVNRFETATTAYGTPSLRTVLEYDDANRIVLLSHKHAEHQGSVNVLAQYDFEYDFASRITAIDSFVDGLSEFTFSTTNQLTAAEHDSSSNNPNEDYQYDANGNRIGTGFVVDAQNRTMSDGVYDYEYDAEGNRTRRTLISDDSYEINTFDHRNRLTKVEFYNSSDVLQQSVTYTYDAFNRLVRRSVDSDGDLDIDRDQFFAGFDGDNSTLEFDGPDDTDLAHRRLWGPFMDQLIASEEVDGLMTEGEVFWPVTDHVGTIRDIGDLDDGTGGSGDFIIVSHRVYSSFGLLTDEYDPATSNPSGIDIEFGFTGRFTDDLTGMTHHQHRWYDPHLGKWISEDPLGFAAGDINTTRYVGNAPLSYTDPSGLIAVSIDGGNGDADNGSGFWDRVGGVVVGLAVAGHQFWNDNVDLIGGRRGDCFDEACNGVSGVGDYSSLGLSYGIRTNLFDDQIDYDSPVYRTTATGTQVVLVAAGGVGIVRGGVSVLRGGGVLTPSGGFLRPGATVYRVTGGAADEFGRSWTTVDPRVIPNLRSGFGLYPGNTAGNVVVGVIRNLDDVIVTRAAPGPLTPPNVLMIPEIIVPNPVIQITRLHTLPLHP